MQKLVSGYGCVIINNHLLASTMGHLLIILYNISLIEGLAIAFYLYHQQKSFSFDYLKDIIRKLLLINSYVFIRLASYYLKLNVDRSVTDEFTWILPLRFLLSFIIIFLVTYYLLKISHKLLARELSAKLIQIFIGLVFICTLFLGIALAVYYIKKSSALLYYANTITHILGLIIIILSLIYLLVKGHGLRRGPSNRIALAFGYPYVIFVSLALLLICFPNRYDIYFLAILFIFINTFNFIWFKTAFLKNYGPPPMGMINKATILKAIEDYQLSHREGEILELILQGKENKEIEDLLYISINTVKNHVHSIFKKIKVKSRQQLIKKILNLI
jgi:DNA-binding CsgD family transcriptional regulator